MCMLFLTWSSCPSLHILTLCKSGSFMNLFPAHLWERWSPAQTHQFSLSGSPRHYLPSYYIIRGAQPPPRSLIGKLFPKGIGETCASPGLPTSQPPLWSLSLSHTDTPRHPGAAEATSPTPQFKSINSLALSFLSSSTLTSIHDCWKNHSLD